MAQAKRDFELKKATYDTEVRFLRLRKWKQTLEKLKKQLICALRRLKMRNFEKTSFYMLPSASAQLDAPHQVNTAKAEAEMAYQLQASKVNARIKEEEMQVRFFSFDGNFEFWQTKVKVVEREQQIAIQQQEIQRKEKELNSKVWKDITGSDILTERWVKIFRVRFLY